MLNHIKFPTLLLNEKQVRENIERMADKAKRNGVRFRPHFKTHQSAEIGSWFRGAGVECITVSSMQMASYFAENGWDDITVAFPANLREIETIKRLSKRIRLNLLLESVETINFLETGLAERLDVWIKIDTGSHRTGVIWNDGDRLQQIGHRLQKPGKLELRGLLTHTGHTYKASSIDEIAAIYRDTIEKLAAARQSLESCGFSELEISVGDTPSAAVLESFGGVTEIRPGNFVFYDVMQLQAGVCTEPEIAVAVACPVVAIHPERCEVVIYGGAVHLSKESVVNESGTPIFGLVAPLNNNGNWGAVFPDTFVKSLSQEHGIIRTTPNLLRKFKIGDLIAVLPVHSCLTVNLNRRYQKLTGETVTTGIY